MCTENDPKKLNEFRIALVDCLPIRSKGGVGVNLKKKLKNRLTF